jgi:hypothetical protein
MVAPMGTRFRDFLWEFRHHWFAALSGGFSVPFTIATVFAGDKFAQAIFGALAFSGLVFAAYQVWKPEREKVIRSEEKVISLEEALRPKIKLTFDPADSRCFHFYENHQYAHLIVRNKGTFGIDQVQVMLESVEFADANGQFKRVEKYRTALILGWCHLNDFRKFSPNTLPPGDRLMVDLISTAQLRKCNNMDPEWCFLVNASLEHTQFTEFEKPGKYLLTALASSPKTSSNILVLLVEWDGTISNLKVSDVSASSFVRV